MDDLSPIVNSAIQIFSKDLSCPKSVGEVADAVGVSSRHLERSFKQSTGENPTRYFRRLRMQAARQIVLYTNDKISDVAAAVGYSSSKYFVRHYRAAYKIAPLDDRRKINLHRVKANRALPSV